MRARAERARTRELTENSGPQTGELKGSYRATKRCTVLWSTESTLLTMGKTALILLGVAAMLTFPGCSSRHGNAAGVRQHTVEKFGYIDAKGRVVVRPQFDQVSSFSEGLAAVLVAGKWGYINRNGKMVIEPTFEECNPISERLAAVYIGGCGFGYIDHSGKAVIKPSRRFSSCARFSEGMAAVAFGRDASGEPCNFGYISRSGKLAIQPGFACAGDFSNGLALVADRKGWALIDRSGTTVSRIRRGIPYPAEKISEGLISARIGDRYGYINTSGKIAVKPQYDETQDFHQGRAAVQMGGNGHLSEGWGYIDKNGRIIVAPRFVSGDSFSDELASVRVEGSLDYGYIDREGKMAIPARFREANPFSGGFALVRIGTWNWSYIDKHGKVVIAMPHSDAPATGNLRLDCSPWGFSEGRAPCAIMRKETKDEASRRQAAERNHARDDDRQFR